MAGQLEGCLGCPACGRETERPGVQRLSGLLWLPSTGELGRGAGSVRWVRNGRRWCGKAQRAMVGLMITVARCVRMFHSPLGLCVSLFLGAALYKDRPPGLQLHSTADSTMTDCT